ncbi:MAG: hypothetical protein PUC68_08120 [Firmicutes bacterium]|nr:hypothetical protein [Bacillota bacterium]
MSNMVDVNVIDVADALSISIYDGKNLVFVDTATNYSWKGIKNTIEKAKPKSVSFFLSHWDKDHYGNLFSAISYCVDCDIHIKELVLPTPPNNYAIQKGLNEVMTKMILKKYPELKIENPINFSVDEVKVINECLYRYLETANGLHDRNKSFDSRFGKLSKEGQAFVRETVDRFNKSGNGFELYREAQLDIFSRTDSLDVKSLVINEYVNPTVDSADKDKRLFKEAQMLDFERDLRREYSKRNIKGLPRELISTRVTFIDKPKEYIRKTIRISDDVVIEILRVNPELYNKGDKKLNKIDTTNNNSILMCLKVKNTKFFFPGDSETVLENAMEQIFKKGKALDFKNMMEEAVVQIMAHHGLDSATGHYALSHAKNVRIGISSIGREHGDDSNVKSRCNFRVLSTYFLDDIHLTVKDDEVYVRTKKIQEQSKRDLKEEIVSQKRREGDLRNRRLIANLLPNDFNELNNLCEDVVLKTLTLGINIKNKIFNKDFLINNPKKYENAAYGEALLDEYNDRIDDFYQQSTCEFK